MNWSKKRLNEMVCIKAVERQKLIPKKKLNECLNSIQAVIIANYNLSSIYFMFEKKKKLGLLFDFFAIFFCLLFLDNSKPNRSFMTKE